MNRNALLLVSFVVVCITMVFMSACAKKSVATNNDNASVQASAYILSQDSPFLGTWEGTLKAGGASLVLRFAVNQNGVLIDVPAQGVKAAAASEVKVEGNKLVVVFDSFKASMEARQVSGDALEAEWIQGAGRYPLPLVRANEEALKAAAERNAELASRGEKVRFQSVQPGVELEGTLRLPDGSGPFSCLILITGSGPQDRDETIHELKPFRDIAEMLALRGWATLRYDDRGVGGSGGSFTGSTSSDFALDAVGAYRFAVSDSRIDPQRVALAGHSEGGYVAMLAENAIGGLQGLVLLAAPGVRGYDILMDQSADLLAAMGATQVAIAVAAAANKTVYDLILSSDRFPEDAVRATLKKAGVPEDQLAIQLAGLSDPWFKHFLNADPAIPLSAIRSPVLALNGSKDLQVRADRNLAAIESSIKKTGMPVRTIKLDGLNHLFQQADSGLPGEYASLSSDFNAQVMETIAAWLEELPPAKQ